MANCLFCNIISGSIPSKKVYEDELTYAFEDISPQAPVHVLVISKQHVKNLVEASNHLSAEALNACFHTCVKVAQLTNLDKNGFRIVSNCGPDACQSVEHFHIHVLGGKALSGQMG